MCQELYLKKVLGPKTDVICESPTCKSGYPTNQDTFLGHKTSGLERGFTVNVDVWKRYEPYKKIFVT